MKSKTSVVKCGTCEFWTGQRTPIFDANGNPKVDIIDSKGFCENGVSNFFDIERSQNLKCKHFSKWTEIL